MRLTNMCLSRKSRFVVSLKNIEFSVCKVVITSIILTLVFVLNDHGIANAEWADKIIDAKVVARHEDNINLAFFEDEERKEATVVSSLSLGRIYQLGNSLRIRATGDFEGKLHNKYHGLNSGYVGATIGITYKTGLGLYRPWIRAHSSGGYLQVNDTLRDSGIGEAGLTIGKRINERIDLEAAYVYDFRKGRGKTSAVAGLSGSVFDQDGHKLSASSNFLITNKFLFSLGYSIRHGDIASTCNGEIVPQVVEKILAITTDTSYNNPLCTYKIRSTTQDFSLGMTYAINGHSSLNFSYDYLDGKATGLGYRNNIVRLGFNYSF